MLPHPTGRKRTQNLLKQVLGEVYLHIVPCITLGKEDTSLPFTRKTAAESTLIISQTAVKYRACNYLQWGWAAFLNPHFQLKFRALWTWPADKPLYLNSKSCFKEKVCEYEFLYEAYIKIFFSECWSDILVNFKMKDKWEIISTFMLNMILKFLANGKDSCLWRSTREEF